MGMGLYDLLGWGVLNPTHLLLPPEPDGTVWIDDRLGEAIEHLGLESNSETAPAYLVIPLAVSDEVLQDYWTLPALPDWCPRVAPRRARRITSRLAARDAQALAAQRGVDLLHVWQETQRIYREHGLVLPAAGLILVNDWD